MSVAQLCRQAIKKSREFEHLCAGGFICNNEVHTYRYCAWYVYSVLAGASAAVVNPDEMETQLYLPGQILSCAAPSCLQEVLTYVSFLHRLHWTPRCSTSATSSHWYPRRSSGILLCCAATQKQTHALHRANKRTVSFFFTKCLRPREVSNKHM